MVDQIDQNLYSRQLGTYGIEAMGKLIALRVYIYGLRGVGIETAKNLILAGPKRVTIQDDDTVRLKDLGSNFYCKETDVDTTTRARACIDELKGLNSYVDVQIHEGQINNEFLCQFDIVVFTDYLEKEKLFSYNNFCRTREKPIGFIYTGCLGLYGFTFVDFGNSFTVWDKNGEEPKSVPIAIITQDKPATVSTYNGNKHGLTDGDVIRFKDVRGMPELNGEKFTIAVESTETFTINVDTRNFGNYQGGAVAEQVRIPETVSFKSLEDSLFAPLLGPDYEMLLTPDFSKLGRSDHLHIGLNTMLDYVRSIGRMPRLNNQEDAEYFLEMYRTVNENIPRKAIGALRVDEIDENLVKNIAMFAEAQTTCHSAFFGAIAAQEVVKFTGKFMPLRQWLHYENFELLPSGHVNRDPLNSRYDDQIAIFGRDIQEKLSNKRIFLVGAGALGCEYIKEFALAGICCGPKGKLICTDDDNIEISNLNRQFLFRKENVGSSKSQVACAVGRKLNKDLNVEPMKLRVSPESENVFNDDFWERIDTVVTAVDTATARRYLDSKCVFFGKYLFNSGTLGLICTSETVIPHSTQSLNESPDPPGESIPMCTLKNFPYQIEHTIQWARDYFEGNFVEGPNEYQKYLEEPIKYIQILQNELRRQPSLLRSRFESVFKIRNLSESKDEKACIVLARKMFQDIFYNQIVQLLHTLPPDSQTNGQPFWTGLKKLPAPIVFDPKDPLHVDFIFATANLMAYTLGKPPLKDKEIVANCASTLIIADYKPRRVVIKMNDTDTTEEIAEDDEAKIMELARVLSEPIQQPERTVNVSVFEKDDDKNFHIDFISAVANLRARNYKIDEVPKLKVKFIAGKIIPAVATSTAMIVGTVGFEIYKFAADKSPELFKNSFCNLGISRLMFSEVMPPIHHKDEDYNQDFMGPVKAIPKNWTTWDRIEMDGPKTLNEIFSSIKSRYSVNLSVAIIEGEQIYIEGLSDEDRLDMTPEEAYQATKGEAYPAYKKYVEIGITGETFDGVNSVLPPIKYFRKT